MIWAPLVVTSWQRDYLRTQWPDLIDDWIGKGYIVVDSGTARQARSSSSKEESA